ncbi:MAG: hypothetical protein Q7S52_05665 [bacterium]|nr:hypothetical protein [bacterium]
MPRSIFEKHEMYVSEEIVDALNIYGFVAIESAICCDETSRRIEVGSKVSLICTRNQALNWVAEVVAVQNVYGNPREQILIFKK